jgi:hypothetical protein
MIGYNFSGSVLTNAKSRTLLTADSAVRSSFFFPLLVLLWICLSTLSTSSSAFLKSFWPPRLSDPFSSMSSRARSRSLRSLSDSPKRQIGCPLARRRRIVSSMETLNEASWVGGCEISWVGGTEVSLGGWGEV